MSFDVGPNIVVIALALIAIVPGAIAAYFARKASVKVDDVGHRIDGRLDTVISAAHARGVLAGQADPKAPPSTLVDTLANEVTPSPPKEI